MVVRASKFQNTLISVVFHRYVIIRLFRSDKQQLELGVYNDELYNVSRKKSIISLQMCFMGWLHELLDFILQKIINFLSSLLDVPVSAAAGTLRQPLLLKPLPPRHPSPLASPCWTWFSWFRTMFLSKAWAHSLKTMPLYQKVGEIFKLVPKPQTTLVKVIVV